MPTKSIILFLLLFIGQWASAQIDSVIVQDANCPSNGELTFIIQDTCVFSWVITDAPNSTYVNLTGTDTFITSLEPGQYVLDFFCDLVLVQTDTFQIEDAYETLQQEVGITNVCANFSNGATIFSEVTGGTRPFEYAIFSGSNANISDNSSKVQNAYSSDSFLVVTEFGNHVVRVKDACGEFITSVINVQASTPPLRAGVNGQLGGPVCGSNTDTAWSGFYLISDNGSNISSVPSAGMIIKIYSGHSSFVDDVTPPSSLGTLFYMDTVYDAGADIKVPTSGEFLIVVETACGDVRYHDHEWDPDETTFNTEWAIWNSSCSSTATQVDLKHIRTTFESDPVDFTLYNGSGAYVCNSTWEGSSCFKSLPTSAGPYRIVATDACGTNDTVDFVNPSGSAAPSVTDLEANPNCVTINGRSSVRFRIDGNIPKFDEAFLVVSSGPSNVGDTAEYYSWNGMFNVVNLIPGGTYVFDVVYPASTGCGSLPSNSFTITVPTGYPLDMSMSPVVTQLCGGGATIETNYDFNGWSSLGVRLYDKDWNKVDDNLSGNFSVYDTTASKYYLQMFSDISGCPSDSISLIDSVELSLQGAPPKVAKRIGVVCENSSGTLLNVGYAALDADGAAPFTFEMKLKGASSYNAVSGDSMTGYLGVDNLVPDSTYNFRVTDVCGNAVVTEIAVSRLGELEVERDRQPCVGSSFTLRAPDRTSATYNWYKVDSAGNELLLASTRSYAFANYQPSDDGVYKCVMEFGVNGGGCITRTVTVTLNNRLCGSEFSENQITGTVYEDLNVNQLFDNGEVQTIGVKVNLWLDANSNGIIDSSESIVDTKVTDANGFYLFATEFVGDSMSYIVNIDTTDLPTGSSLTTDNYEYARFTSGGNIDENNDFGHTKCEMLTDIASRDVTCVGEDILVAASPAVSGADYAWTFSNGSPSSSTAASELVSWSGTGTENIQLIVSDATCSDTFTKSIEIRGAVLASAAPSEEVCRGGQVDLDATGTTAAGASYLWSVVSGDPGSIDANATSLAPTVSPYINSQYRLTVTDTASGCSDVAFVNVSVDVNLNPTASLSGPSGAIHDSSMVFLDGTASAAPASNPTATLNYSWLEDGAALPTWNYDTMTTEVSGYTDYGIVVIDASTGCADTAVVSVSPTLPPVPVELIGIRASLQGSSDVLVSWSTATELNNEKFEVQRRYEYEQEFTTLGEVAGAGNSSTTKHYKFLDETSQWLSPVVYYRIKQLDYDGQYEYSYAVPVSKQSDLELMVYPNPAQSETVVAVLGDEEIKILRVLDMYGKDVSVDVDTQQESDIYTLGVQALRNGTYFIEVITETQRSVERIQVAR